MLSVRRLIPALAVVVSFGVVGAAAQAKAVPQMAAILMNFNHFPSDAEKATLKTIIGEKTTTAHERTVAEVLLAIQHTASAADKARLEAIVKDTAAPEGVKTLAGILATVTHTPTAADKERLKKIGS